MLWKFKEHLLIGSFTSKNRTLRKSASVIYPPSVYVESLRKSTKTEAFHERRHSKGHNSTYTVWVAESKIKCWLGTKILCNKEYLSIKYCIIVRTEWLACVEESRLRTQLQTAQSTIYINGSVINIIISIELSDRIIGITLPLLLIKSMNIVLRYLELALSLFIFLALLKQFSFF